MKKTSAVLACLCGALGATILVVACSDDSPGDADAAVCDCPAAEAPLAGRIMRVRGNTFNVPPDGGSSFGVAGCPAGATLLGGGCMQDGFDDSELLLTEAGTTDNGLGYECHWRNDNTVQFPVYAEAICLVPAQ